jgi:hypothetical protein
MNLRPVTQPVAQRSPHRWILVVAAAGSVIGIMGLTRFLSPHTGSSDTAEIPVASTTEDPSLSLQALPVAPSDSETIDATGNPPSDVDAISDPSPRDPFSPEVQQVMTRLAAILGVLKSEGAAVRPETLNEWKTGLRDLVGTGTVGIPAILEFISAGTDVLFSLKQRAEVGQWSARTGLIQALRQIGGPEAISAMGQILDKTQSYQELALLAQGLEEGAPGQYRDQAVAIARAQLATAISSTANTETADIAPLFEVLGAYANPDAAQDLEAAAGRWKYYSMSALAKLPEGSGVPSLIRLADPNSPSGNRLQALQVLTELAPSNDTARNFLISQASSGGIPAQYWSYLNQPLAGNQYFVADAILTQYPTVSNWGDLQTIHINAGNQTLYSIPSTASQTHEGIQRQLALIDQLSGFAQDTAAQTTLKQARLVLELRMQRITIGQPAFTAENP